MAKKLLFILACALLLPRLSYSLTPAEELTQALAEVTRPSLENEVMDVTVTITDYRIEKGHLADFRMEYKAALPQARLNGELLTVYEGPSRSQTASSQDKKALLKSRNTLNILDKSLQIGLPMQPIPKSDWDAHVAAMKKSEEDPDHALKKQGLSVKLEALQENKKGEIEAFEVLLSPSNEKQLLPFDVRMIFSIGQEAYSFDLSLESRGDSASLLDESDEKQVVEFLENIRRRDPATMMVAQSMAQLLKGYAGIAMTSGVK